MPSLYNPLFAYPETLATTVGDGLLEEAGPDVTETGRLLGLIELEDTPEMLLETAVDLYTRNLCSPPQYSVESPAHTSSGVPDWSVA